MDRCTWHCHREHTGLNITACLGRFPTNFGKNTIAIQMRKKFISLVSFRQGVYFALIYSINRNTGAAYRDYTYSSAHNWVKLNVSD
jgi:hypothetical protein